MSNLQSVGLVLFVVSVLLGILSQAHLIDAGRCKRHPVAYHMRGATRFLTAAVVLLSFAISCLVLGAIP